jgi:hypothetical protein
MTSMTRSNRQSDRALGAVLTAGIVALALTTGWIHFNLGGLLFTLNGLGYAGLAALYVIAAVAPHPLIARFSWAPRVALAGYALLTIVGWAIQGPYYSTAYIAKAVEVALIALIVADTFRVYGGPLGLVRAAFASIAWVFGRGGQAGPAAA